MCVCVCVDITNHYYNVSFSPEHTTKDPPHKEMEYYARLYSSKTSQSFIRIFTDTVAASKCKDHIKIDYLLLDKMLNEINDVQFVNDRSVDLALGPLKVYNLSAGDSFFHITLTHEEVKNEFFFHTMSHLLPSFFCLGRIDIPQKNSYSKYGKSRQDLCVIHEKYTTPTAALLSWVEPADEEVDASAGIFEYKNKGYAEQQGLKEMMCAAGNLVAKVLSTGKRPVIVTIYGMAADYATKKGKLLRLDINFHDNIALSYCSDGIISVSKGVNWMLNGISPRR